jgi:hypothetical protein
MHHGKLQSVFHQKVAKHAQDIGDRQQRKKPVTPARSKNMPGSALP